LPALAAACDRYSMEFDRPFGPWSLSRNVAADTPNCLKASIIVFDGWTRCRNASAMFSEARCAESPCAVILAKTPMTSFRPMPAADACGTMLPNAEENSSRFVRPCFVAMIIFEVMSAASDAFRW
jgi:hypothetical protein